MYIARHKFVLSAVFTSLLFVLFAFSGPLAYGDELFIEEVNELFAQDEFLDSEELIDGARPVKAANAVSEFKQKVNGIGSAVNMAARDAVAGSANVEISLPFVLAGLFILMLMLRFKKRSKKKRFY